MNRDIMLLEKGYKEIRSNLKKNLRQEILRTLKEDFHLPAGPVLDFGDAITALGYEEIGFIDRDERGNFLVMYLAYGVSLTESDTVIFHWRDEDDYDVRDYHNESKSLDVDQLIGILHLLETLLEDLSKGNVSLGQDFLIVTKDED